MMKDRILGALRNTPGTGMLEPDLQEIVAESIMDALLPVEPNVYKRPFIEQEYIESVIKREVAERLNGHYGVGDMLNLFREMFGAYHKEEISYSKVSEIVRGLLLLQRDFINEKQ